MKVTSKRLKNKKFIKYKKGALVKERVEKRYKLLIVVIVLVFSVLITDLFYIQVVKNSYYVERVKILSNNLVEGSSTPRGRIYDRNGKVIVDNEAVKTITYKRESGMTTNDEIEICYKLAEILEIDYKKLSDTNLRKFWLKNNSELANSRITEDEWNKLRSRQISSSDIEKYKLERINEEELNSYKEIDKEAAYINYLMNNGYAYNEKVIKKDVSDIEYSLVAENVDSMRGVDTKLDWERSYPYGSTFRSILGNVSTNESGIPYELKDYYLSLGYSLNDRVGISYLEYQYEDILKGKKALYKVSNSGDNILVEEGSRGNDIVLTIDIELQKEVEKILEEQMIRAKQERNTEYYNKSFVIISNPNTGEILVMAGKQIVFNDGEYKIYDYTPGVITSSVVSGSIVKGASHIVGYNTGSLKIGEVRNDACIKIAATPLKCSWKYLGNINDIAALKYSSNTYQFNTAIKVGKGNYVYDGGITLDKNAFDTYRNTFREFGLGVKTGIDLPNESLGYKGSSTLAGHLFDFSIGQYDTYTPIQLSQYINTIANGGNRVQPYLLKGVYKPTKEPLTELVSETETVVLNKVNTNEEYIKRVQEGFKAVMEYGGTGSGYVNLQYKPAGKTGTSQSFIDTDGNGVVDKETISNTFAAYAPYDNPVVSFTVVSPDIYHYDNGSSTRSYVNMRIAKEVSKKFFEIYQ